MNRFSPFGFLSLRFIAAGFRLAQGFVILFQEGEGVKLAGQFEQAGFPVPTALAWGGGFLGLLGGLFLLIGLGTRFVAVFLLLWVGAILGLEHTLNPEADITALSLQVGILFSLFFLGGGPISMDAYIGLAVEDSD